MSLIHALFDANKFTDSIPDTIGLMMSLEVLNLASNQLTGLVPDLTGMTNLAYVDLSNNSFSPSETPTWFTGLPFLTTTHRIWRDIRASATEAIQQQPPTTSDTERQHV